MKWITKDTAEEKSCAVVLGIRAHLFKGWIALHVHWINRGLSFEKIRDALLRIWIKSLKETYLRVGRGLFTRCHLNGFFCDCTLKDTLKAQNSSVSSWTPMPSGQNLLFTRRVSPIFLYGSFLSWGGELITKQWMNFYPVDKNQTTLTAA